MSELHEIEREFGMTVAAAAAKAGAAGMMERLPADDIYEVVVDVALTFAATMSASRMTETEFMVQCRLRWRDVCQKREARAKKRKRSA